MLISTGTSSPLKSILSSAVVPQSGIIAKRFTEDTVERGEGGRERRGREGDI
jgi:hypothetical protein